MAGYLQHYGVDEEKRNRIIIRIILASIAVVVLAIIAYFVFHNFSEKQAVKRFLADVNARKFQDAYRDWGCSAEHPCPNYDFNRFMEDWGPAKKVASPWKIASVDGCKTFVTVNVQAEGSELQSLGVERGTDTIMYAPSPECQERQWRWKQFFQRIFHGGSSS
jgi:ABC-type lipoprotein release transport system permease subunit